MFDITHPVKRVVYKKRGIPHELFVDVHGNVRHTDPAGDTHKVKQSNEAKLRALAAAKLKRERRANKCI